MRPSQGQHGVIRPVVPRAVAGRGQAPSCPARVGAPGGDPPRPLGVVSVEAHPEYSNEIARESDQKESRLLERLARQGVRGDVRERHDRPGRRPGIFAEEARVVGQGGKDDDRRDALRILFSPQRLDGVADRAGRRVDGVHEVVLRDHSPEVVVGAHLVVHHLLQIVR